MKNAKGKAAGKDLRPKKAADLAERTPPAPPLHRIIAGGPTMRRRKPRVHPIRRDDPESLSTEELIELHERLCAPLDPAARSRIVDAASRRGWDRGWGLDGLAA